MKVTKPQVPQNAVISRLTKDLLVTQEGLYRIQSIN
jgi:hypothetical protein